MFTSMQRFIGMAGGAELRGRVARSLVWIVLGFGGAQVLRLGGNLLLTRLLFPEAFGLMTLVTVFLVGLTMFSDVGLTPLVQQSARGDDPRFLDTVWSIQVIRGVLLWLLGSLLAAPAAWLYDQPALQAMLPVAALSLLVSGFNPTRIDTAARHLQVGRVTVLDFISQAVGLAAMVALAALFLSVWALVIGSVVTAAIRVALMWAFLPGQSNRFRWEREAVRELIGFGKWVLLSTACAFVLSQGDKAVLGKVLSLESLGVYNIGFFIGSFPLMLAAALNARLFIPIYRERPPRASAANYRALRRFRFLFTAGAIGLQGAVLCFGTLLIQVLYDPRFADAGAVTVAVAAVNVIVIVGMTYENAALAAGDARGAFFVVLAKAVTQMALFLLGLHLAGLPGGFVGLGLSAAATYGVIVLIARRHGAWDPLHDAVWYAVALGLIGLGLALNGDVWGGLAHLGGG